MRISRSKNASVDGAISKNIWTTYIGLHKLKMKKSEKSGRNWEKGEYYFNILYDIVKN